MSNENYINQSQLLHLYVYQSPLPFEFFASNEALQWVSYYHEQLKHKSSVHTFNLTKLFDQLTFHHSQKKNRESSQ
jgi:hypothetical protein